MNSTSWYDQRQGVVWRFSEERPFAAVNVIPPSNCVRSHAPINPVKHAKVSASTVRRWVNNFYSGGVEGWRAYHTPVHYLTGDPQLQAAIRQAVAQARVRVPVRVATREGMAPTAKLGRSHMNPYLRCLMERFGDWSVDDLRDMAERRLGRTVGTVYVGDLLAMCAVLEDAAQLDQSTAPGAARS